ncbi:CsgG/HfaB family protein [Dyadobacter sp. CY326]|uniref:CsgG/HfaB family protein n=1 Tax=Dyadobacter sp. CY326 TaxID=2907300 RepID=UPI001F3D6D95|nr:CsgG/HfaB family protein [Dyadobacter sp. CY326]MCE7065092.1 curli production assembly protein CsgG [Dyadobacter sp. CY326]
MKRIFQRTKLLLTIAILSFALQGCSSYFHQPTSNRNARLGEETGVTQGLRTLPPPSDKLAVAVYKFRDQTGQYKPSENGINYSTAVTQGGTNILLKALEESGWFTTIERENVSNLLNERKIIRSSVAQYKPENENLPPLLFAGIILEGGIISYDANIITGGAGLKYFGAGGSTQYRQDRVTVYLRAVATKTGKILKTIYTSKTILSQSFQAGMFRFVRFKRLLEAETGFTINEPSQMAVTEAIEKSVQSLIIEGIRDGLWTAEANQKTRVANLLADYNREEIESRETNIYGARNDAQRLRFSLMPTTSMLRYSGDYGPSSSRAGVGVALNFGLTPHWNVQTAGVIGNFAAQEYFKRKVIVGELNLQYRFLPYQKINPFVQLGTGIVSASDKSYFDSKSKVEETINAGLGLEYMVSRTVGIHISCQYNYFFEDSFDLASRGSHNDAFWKASAGLSIYLGGRYKR